MLSPLDPEPADVVQNTQLIAVIANQQAADAMRKAADALASGADAQAMNNLAQTLYAERDLVGAR